MKILFLSVTAGQGHHSTARACMNELQHRGVACTILDTMKYINPLVGDTLDKGYLALTKYSPKSLRLFYDGALKNKKQAQQNFTRFTGAVFYKPLEKYIDEYKPDAIVCTHVYAASILAYLKKKTNLDIPLIGINTDFSIHPFWEVTDMDYFVLACDEMVSQAVKRGFDVEKLMPLGIPVHKKFSEGKPKEQAQEELGLENMPTVLIMSGSMGFGKVTDYLKLLDGLQEDIQILCVCANNKKLYNQATKLEMKKKTKIFGYIDNISTLIDASDILITKPGGLTVSECMAKRIPLVLMDPIPGLEERNAAFLLNNGLALACNDDLKPDDAVHLLLSDDDRRNHIIKMQEKIGKPHAASDLAEGIIELVQNRYAAEASV